MTISWEKRRSEFNHDWLKNRYLPVLAKCVNILDDCVEDPQFEMEFVETVLPQWVEYRPQAMALVERFEVEMSPALLLSQPPLSVLPEGTKMWLSELISALWLSRYPVERWKSELASCVVSTNEAYMQLHSLVQAEQIVSIAQLRPWRSRFTDFQTRCQALAKSIEVFPSKLLVT